MGVWYALQMYSYNLGKSYSMKKIGEDILKYKFKTSKGGFTLAEVLIVIGIIGVIAALVMPTLLLNIQHKVLDTRRKVETRKLTQSVEVMASLNTLAGHQNTAEFVNELKNHLLMAKICGESNVSECWAYSDITLADDSSFNLASAADGDALFHMGGLDPDGNQADYSTRPVTFLMGDGIYFVIAYNKLCNTDGSETRNCFVAAFDANGSKMPNKVGEDIFIINSNQFGSSNAEGGGSNADNMDDPTSGGSDMSGGNSGNNGGSNNGGTNNGNGNNSGNNGGTNNGGSNNGKGNNSGNNGNGGLCDVPVIGFIGYIIGVCN